MAECFAQNLNEPVEALPHQRLSEREFDVFQRIVAGQSLTEIANELCVSVKTIIWPGCCLTSERRSRLSGWHCHGGNGSGRIHFPAECSTSVRLRQMGAWTGPAMMGGSGYPPWGAGRPSLCENALIA